MLPLLQSLLSRTRSDQLYFLTDYLFITGPLPYLSRATRVIHLIKHTLQTKINTQVCRETSEGFTHVSINMLKV